VSNSTKSELDLRFEVSGTDLLGSHPERGVALDLSEIRPQEGIACACPGPSRSRLMHLLVEVYSKAPFTLQGEGGFDLVNSVGTGIVTTPPGV
jgi:hypothetical protein